MKLQNFSGGLNIKDAPHLLKVNQSVEYTNIDNESGELKPSKALTNLGQTFNDKDKFIDHLDTITPLAKTPLDFIEYQDKIYYSVEDDFIQMKDVAHTINTEGDLGLVPPDIIGLSLINTVVSILIPDDIVIKESVWPIGSPGFFFKKDITYHFAFIKLDDAGNQSNVLYYDYVPNGDNVQLQISIRFKHFIHLKTGGFWRRLITPYSILYYTYFPDQLNVGSLTGLKELPGQINVTYETWLSDYTRSSVNVNFSTPFLLIILAIIVDLSDDQNIITSEEVDLTPLNVGQTLAIAGTYIYLATLGIFHLGWESEPSNIISAIITDSEIPEFVIDASFDENGDPYIDSRVDKLYIYRLGNTITDFTLLKTIDNPNDKFPITLIDREPDTNISGHKILNSEDNDKPLIGLKNLNVINGQLISLINSRLYFSPIGKLFALPPTNYRNFRDNLISSFNIDAGLIVCSLTKTWLLNTTNIATGKILQLSEEFGCTSQKTMAGYRTGCIWSSENGIASSFGGKVELIAKEFLGYANLNITHAKIHHETYFGFSTQGACIALDLRYGKSIKRFNFLDFIDVDENTILRQIYIQNQKLKVLFGTTILIDSYTIFGSTENETFIWKSPDFIEGSYTDIKTYKDIYVYATKDINFKTFIDDILVNEINFKTTDNHHIKVDHENHQGFKINFEATGKGTIKEIEYKAMGSQDGR